MDVFVIIADDTTIVDKLNEVLEKIESMSTQKGIISPTIVKLGDLTVKKGGGSSYSTSKFNVKEKLESVDIDVDYSRIIIQDFKVIIDNPADTSASASGNNGGARLYSSVSYDNTTFILTVNHAIYNPSSVANWAAWATFPGSAYYAPGFESQIIVS